jgi:hypothetical protein
MKTSKILVVAAAAALAAAGCANPVNLSGSYATPAQDITGTVNLTTNSVTVGGDYSRTNETVGGTVTVDK